MAHSVTIKLNKPAKEFQASGSIGFNVRGGVQYYNHKTKQKEWTNYSATIFAKASGQIDFYRSALVEGAIVEIGSKQLMIDVFQGNNDAVYTIGMVDAWLGSINNLGHAPQQSAPKMVVTPPAAPVDPGFDDTEEPPF